MAGRLVGQSERIVNEGRSRIEDLQADTVQEGGRPGQYGAIIGTAISPIHSRQNVRGNTHRRNGNNQSGSSLGIDHVKAVAGSFVGDGPGAGGRDCRGGDFR